MFYHKTEENRFTIYSLILNSYIVLIVFEISLLVLLDFHHQIQKWDRQEITVVFLCSSFIATFAQNIKNFTWSEWFQRFPTFGQFSPWAKISPPITELWASTFLTCYYFSKLYHIFIRGCHQYLFQRHL